MLNVLIGIVVVVWAMSAIILAAAVGAMFSPDKKKIISRSIISVLLLIPMFIIVPLSFAIGILISVLIFIAGVTIFGVRIVCELITDGIPEMDEEGNYIVKDEKPSTAPWI